MPDDVKHPSEVAYEAGIAYAKAHPELEDLSDDELDEKLLKNANRTEDPDAFIDGFWDGWL